MNRVKVIVYTAIIVAALVMAASSQAGRWRPGHPHVVVHVLGNGGKQYVFDAACHRVSFIPPGISVAEGLNVIAQQTRCLVRRPTFAACVHKLGPPPQVASREDHGVGKPADWTNVDKLQAYDAAVWACSDGTF